MANSGYFYTSGYYDEGWPYRWRFDWKLKSQSISGNYSVITWTLKGNGGSTDGRFTTVHKSYVNVNGHEYSSSEEQNVTNTTVRHSGTTTIYHNSDGTKSFSASAKGAFFYSSYNSSGSGTWSLPTIARASSVSCSTANIGSNATISISRASSSFTHTLSYTFGSLSGTIATKTTSTSVSFALPTTFYAQIPNAKSGTGTITCDTYNGSTKIGTKTCSFTANVDESSSKPTLSPTVVDSNSTTTALTGDSSKFIKYYSNASVSTGASARNSATLKSQKITCGAKSISSASGTINKVESGSFTFSATDSRGYTTSQTVTKTLINYVKLTCSMVANAPTTSGVATLNINGNYWNGNFGSVANTLTVQYRYKTQGGTYGSWTNVTVTKSGNTYNATATISGLDYQTTYVFQARAVDKLATVNTDEQARRTTPIFDWGKDSFNVNGDFTINNDTLLNYTQNKLKWGKNTVGYTSETVSVSNGSTVYGAKLNLLSDNSIYLVLCGVVSDSGTQTAFSDIILAGVSTNGTKLIEMVGRGPAYAGGGPTGWAIVKSGTSSYVQGYTHGYRSATSDYHLKIIAIKLDSA